MSFKILFFSHQADFIYGGEVCTLAFMRELRRIGVDVHFASPAGIYHERAKEFAKCHMVPSVQFQRDISQLTRLAPAMAETYRALRSITELERIAVLHATSLKAMAYSWWLSDKVPVIWHHHDILPSSFSNDLWAKGLASRAHRILTPSQATKASLLEAGVPETKVFVLNNGFPIDEWKPRPKRLDGSPLRVAVIGEISQRKGHDRLESIVSQFHRDEVEFQVIGEGLSDPSFASRIRSELSSLGVQFLGRRNDVKELLQNIDVVMVASRQDPLPTVIVEAALSGVPAIGSRVGGIPEMIQHGENGFLAGTTEEFVSALRELQSISHWQRLSSQAREIAVKRYDIRALTDDLLSHYQALQR